MKFVSILGARPQFIKYFSVSRVFKRHKIKDVLIHTGQHYDYLMSKVFFEELCIKKPDYYLLARSRSRIKQINEIAVKAKEIIIREKPDAVLVYGDTNSTLGGAIAAKAAGAPLAHVEAGLRSYDKDMPEEINRVLTDHLSGLLLCPSKQAVLNLKKEGIENIAGAGRPVAVNVGDVMYDSLIYAADIAKKKTTILKKLGISSKNYCLFTMHRQANTDIRKNFQSIINFINKVSENSQVVFPMHPRARKCYRGVKKRFSSRVNIIDPVGYFDILALLLNSRVLFTDSGGMQKEAYWLGIPCVTMRNETEWKETLKGGWNTLFKNYKGLPKPSAPRMPVYGNGEAAERITDSIIKWIKNL